MENESTSNLSERRAKCKHEIERSKCNSIECLKQEEKSAIRQSCKKMSQFENNENTQGTSRGASESEETPFICRTVPPLQAQPIPNSTNGGSNIISDISSKSQHFVSSYFPALAYLTERIIEEVGIFWTQLKNEPIIISSLFLFLCYYLVYFIIYCGFLYRCPCKRCIWFHSINKYRRIICGSFFSFALIEYVCDSLLRELFNIQLKFQIATHWFWKMACPGTNPTQQCDCEDLNERVRQAIREINELTSKSAPVEKESALDCCVSSKTSYTNVNEKICPNYKKICTSIKRNDPRTVICPSRCKFLSIPKWVIYSGLSVVFLLIALFYYYWIWGKMLEYNW